ncbi:MAG TPA: hypothetical protein O0X25_00935 [Methanocorpusculum sp.]|nr:hypothetical protein [Methanocorpusculum sp.]HJJ39875.1 hypothetical protein [Methanocorpusculum sp.]HJJ49172.1 hypothetical protein [Methanocorpusculum sp.]HJJ56830.1 hypothetical protein [Methanocorpusculum sp.]HJJ95636.1 hypothetical protein [Methanocorpusculum sp.]
MKGFWFRPVKYFFCYAKRIVLDAGFSGRTEDILRKIDLKSGIILTVALLVLALIVFAFVYGVLNLR